MNEAEKQEGRGPRRPVTTGQKPAILLSMRSLAQAYAACLQTDH